MRPHRDIAQYSYAATSQCRRSLPWRYGGRFLCWQSARKTPLRRQRSRKDLYLARRLATLEPDELATLDRAAAILERMLDEEGRR